MSRPKIRALIWVFTGAILLCQCGGGGGPTSPSTPTAAATVTGVWDLTFTEMPSGLMPSFVLTLRERGGAVSGTLEIAGEGSVAVNGTFSAGGQMTLTGAEPGGSSMTMQVTVDGPCRNFTGAYHVTDSEGSFTTAVRGVRRSSDAPAPAPTPALTIDNIDFVSSTPPPGGVIHTGLPDPASSRAIGVTTGLAMTFTAASAIDRVARFQVIVEGPQNGVCLTNAAPLGVPTAPVVQLRAGVPLTVTIRELLLTSVCRYPNSVNQVTARLVAETGAPEQTPIYEERFALQYTVVE